MKEKKNNWNEAVETENLAQHIFKCTIEVGDTLIKFHYH